MNKTYARNLDELERIVADTESCFVEHGIDISLRGAVDLAIEELLVNMVKYNRETWRDIALEIHPMDGGIQVSLTDYDVERFDPGEYQSFIAHSTRPPGTWPGSG